MSFSQTFNRALDAVLDIPPESKPDFSGTLERSIPRINWPLICAAGKITYRPRVSIDWGLIADKGNIRCVARPSWLARIGQWLKDHA